jgi:hypothetical protein
MKPKLDPQTTPAQKMERFESALRRVLTVSHDDMQKALVKEEKSRRLRKNKPGPMPGHSSASGRASGKGD